MFYKKTSWLFIFLISFLISTSAVAAVFRVAPADRPSGEKEEQTSNIKEVTTAISGEEVPPTVRSLVEEKDLVELYCLEIKYRSRRLFANLIALDQLLIPLLQEVKAIGIDVRMPDIDNYLRTAGSKREAVCQTQSVDDAKQKVEDLRLYANQIKDDLEGLRSSLAGDLRQKGDELRKKAEQEVKKKIDAWVAEQKEKAEGQLKEEADKLAESARVQLEAEMATKKFSSAEEAQSYAQSRAEQIQAEIKKQIQELAQQKEEHIRSQAELMAEELLGAEAKQFKSLGEKFKKLPAEIKRLANQEEQKYSEYQKKSQQKRQQLIMMVLDRMLEKGIAKIKEKAEMITEARKHNSSVKTVDEYVAELQNIKAELAQQLNKAIANGEEDKLPGLIAAAQKKWQFIADVLKKDLADRYSAVNVCSSAISELRRNKAEERLAYAQHKIEIVRERELKWAEEQLQKMDLSGDDPLRQQTEELLRQLSQTEQAVQKAQVYVKELKEQCLSVDEQTDVKDIFTKVTILRKQLLSAQQQLQSQAESYPGKIKEIYSLLKSK